MDNLIMVTADKRIPTKQKIVANAVELFATNGYTETSVRDIATAVGINASSLYNHFRSKEEILEFLLNAFNAYTENMYNNPDIYTILQNNPTVEGVLSCFEVSLSVYSGDPHFRTLQVIFQEHHRNALIREYVAKIFLDSEEYIVKIINVLKELKIITPEVDPDFWKKIASSLLYAYPNRTMIGIGKSNPGYTGMDLKALLSYMFSLIFSLYSVSES